MMNDEAAGGQGERGHSAQPSAGGRESRPFQITIGSPIDYEELVAYIRIDDAQVALVSQEKGKDNLEVEFFEDTALHKVSYDVLIAALMEAKKQLLQ